MMEAPRLSPKQMAMFLHSLGQASEPGPLVGAEAVDLPVSIELEFSATLRSVLEESLDDALQGAMGALPLRLRESLSFPSGVKQQWQPEAWPGPVVSQGVLYTSPVRGEARAVVHRLCSIVQERFQRAPPNDGLVTVRRFNFADPRDLLTPLAHVGLLVPGEGSGRSPAFVEAAFDETQLPEYVGGISGWDVRGRIGTPSKPSWRCFLVSDSRAPGNRPEPESPGLG